MVSRPLSILFVLSAVLAVVSAFAPIVPVAVEVNVAAQQQPLISTTTTTTTLSTNTLETSVQSFLQANNPIDSSTMTVSLKERPPPPTKEEIEAKKRNFNLWFWGGGFVAPFVATVYYFGPKFWTK